MHAKLNVTMVSLPLGEQFGYYTTSRLSVLFGTNKALYYLFLGIKNKTLVTITNENINNTQFNIRNESTKLFQMHNKKLNFSFNLDQAYIWIFRQAESAHCQNFMAISNIYVLLNKTLLVIKIGSTIQQSSLYIRRRRHNFNIWKTLELLGVKRSLV